MGRGGDELAAEHLLYGRRTYQDPAIDSAQPSALAWQRADSIVAYYRENNLDLFCRGLRGTEGQLFGNTPLVAEILREVSRMEVDRMVREAKIKRRAKGAAEEREDLARTLAKLIHDRAQEWQEGQDQKSILGPEDLELAALRRPGEGPIADYFTRPIAANSCLKGIDNHQTLALLLGDRASASARDAFRTNLRRTAVEVYAKTEPTALAYQSSYSSVAGCLRYSGKSLLLHLRDPNTYGTLCGKYDMRSSKFGSWRDAEISDQYRRCKACQQKAPQEILDKAEGERSDLLQFADDPEAATDRIVDGAAVQKVLQRASRSEQDFNDMVYDDSGNRWRSERATPLRAAMLTEMEDLLKEEIDHLAEREKNLPRAYVRVWDTIGPEERTEMKERGYQVGFRWRAEAPEGNDWKEVFDQEFRHRLIEKENESRVATMGADFDKSHKGEEQIRRMVKRQVRKFIAATPPEVKPEA